MSNVSVKSMNQLLGTFIIKRGGLINLNGDKFIYSQPKADDSCNARSIQRKATIRPSRPRTHSI